MDAVDLFLIGLTFAEGGVTLPALKWLGLGLGLGLGLSVLILLVVGEAALITFSTLFSHCVFAVNMVVATFFFGRDAWCFLSLVGCWTDPFSIDFFTGVFQLGELFTFLPWFLQLFLLPFSEILQVQVLWP